MPSEDVPLVEDPRTIEERLALASTCSTHLRFPFTTLVDGLDDAVGRAYMAVPDRLYVIGRDGKVAYRSGPGPFGLKESEFVEAVGKAAVGSPGAAKPSP